MTDALRDQGDSVTMVGVRPEPRVGQVWFDRDNRVSSRYAHIREVLDDGRVLIQRGRDGTGTKSKVRVDNLKRRFRCVQPSRGL